jgi:D-lactate dehydrogenase (cytochrome)
MTIDAAIRALEPVLGDRLSLSKPDLAARGTSETHFDAMPPDAVAYPRTTQQVSQIVKICAQHRCPVIGYGAGTSLEGPTSAIQGGIAIDFRDMAQVIQVNDADMTVRVQPGLTREALNDDLRATGLFFSGRSARERIAGRYGVDASKLYDGCAVWHDGGHCPRP